MLTIDNGSRRFWYDRTLQYQALRGASSGDPMIKVVGGGLLALALVAAGALVADRLGYFDLN